MTGELAGWLLHPVTLGLAGFMVMSLFVTLEVLLQSLAAMGNVRFQGVIDEYRRLLPLSADSTLPLSRLLDALRWLQVLTVGALWMVVLGLPVPSPWWLLALCLLVPAVLVLGARTAIGPLGEVGVAVLLRTVSPMVWPLVALIGRVHPSPVVPPEDEEEEASEREIQAYVEAGQAAGIIEAEEGEFLESLVEFFDTVAREVMTPRTEMVAVADTVTFDELLEAFSSSRKSRIPVYNDTVDRVVGVVHVKDVVEPLRQDRGSSIDQLFRPCLIVPESKPLGELLSEFQQKHQQMAIVVDEYGGTSGLVTIEDVLEEIVGEIQDEYDTKQPPEWQELGAGEFRLQARASVEILEELFDIEVDEEGIDTVGGLVFARHGTVPCTGDEVVDEVHGLGFTVDEMDERRIVSVTARSAPGKNAEDS
jgi:CBS domain containing-hemolysin-like protein